MPKTMELAEIGGTSSGRLVEDVRRGVSKAYESPDMCELYGSPWGTLALDAISPLHWPKRSAVDAFVTGSGVVTAFECKDVAIGGGNLGWIKGASPVDLKLAVALLADLALCVALVRADDPVEPPQPPPLPAHAQIAAELRELLGVSTGIVASVLGVARETYSRWTTGSQIGEINLSRLQYLHALLSELRRRLGDELRLWLARPVDVATGSPETPLELLRRGQFDRVHSLIVGLPDPQPYDGDSYLALDKLADEPEESWE